MNVAIVSPIRFLTKYSTNFHLCYASLMQESSEYSNYYIKKARTETVILDQSPVLPRKFTMDMGNYFDIASELRPQYLMLPDDEFACTRTVQMSLLFSQLFRKDLRGIELIGNLQGTDLDSLRGCHSSIARSCDLIGLPASTERILPRGQIVKRLRIRRRVLFLEVYNNPQDELPILKNCIGVVTSLPVRLAHDLRGLHEYRPTPSPLDFYLQEEPLPELVERNVKEFIGYYV